MAPHSSTLAWKIPWAEEPGGLQPMGSLGVGHDWETSLSLFTFMHWRRKWQPTPVFLPGESQGLGGLVGCCLCGRRVGRNWSDLAAAVAVELLPGLCIDALVSWSKNEVGLLIQYPWYWVSRRNNDLPRVVCCECIQHQLRPWGVPCAIPLGSCSVAPPTLMGAVVQQTKIWCDPISTPVPSSSTQGRHMEPQLPWLICWSGMWLSSGQQNLGGTN